MRIAKCDLIFFVLSIIFLLSGILTWILFPIIFESEVKSRLQLSQHKDFSLSYSSYMWSRPPMRNQMNFYFFNISNPDELVYNGAKPALVEVGPFAVLEKEQKKYMRWSDDKSFVFYENYKTYFIADEFSGEGCSSEQIVTIPNSVALGAAADIWDPKYNVSSEGRTVVSLAMLLLGEYPFVSHKVREVLFDGYNDAFLDAAQSPLYKVLSGILTGGSNLLPIPVPPMPKMGYFQGYNNTQDEHYWISSGNEDVNEMGTVRSWAGVDILPEDWWSTNYSREIRGTDSGSFSKMHLTKEDVIPMFHSFQCRSFDAKYLEDIEIRGIPSMSFFVAADQYDTTTHENRGFRYRNFEKVNYYPNWPNCPENSPKCEGNVDCTIGSNLCSSCCSNRSHVDGTYMLPPGMFPLVCYPGHLQPTPFSVIYSPPHFLYSPEEVQSSVIGLHPDPRTHLPLVYNHEKFSGIVTRVVYQLMISIPMYASKNVVQLMHLPSIITPIFWQGAHASLNDFTYDYVRFGFVIMPNVMDFITYSCLVIGLLLIVVMFYRMFRKSK